MASKDLKLEKITEVSCLTCTELLYRRPNTASPTMLSCCMLKQIAFWSKFANNHIVGFIGVKPRFCYGEYIESILNHIILQKDSFIANRQTIQHTKRAKLSISKATCFSISLACWRSNSSDKVISPNS